MEVIFLFVSQSGKYWYFNYWTGPTAHNNVCSPPRTIEKHNVPLSFWTTVTVDYGKMWLSCSWTFLSTILCKITSFFPDIRQDLYNCWNHLYWFWIWRIAYKCTQSFVRTLLHAKDSLWKSTCRTTSNILCHRLNPSELWVSFFLAGRCTVPNQEVYVKSNAVEYQNSQMEIMT